MLFQRWYDVIRRHEVISTNKQRWNNIEMFDEIKFVTIGPYKATSATPQFEISLAI